MYDLASAIVSECPAVCKLKNSNEKKDELCHRNDHMVVNDGAVEITSPRFQCGLEYRKKEICIYNVSMTCEANDVAISRNLSKLNLAKNDFLDVIDYSHGQSFQKITGSEFPTERDMHIGSNNFVVLFSSSKGKKSHGNGFSLHVECRSDPVSPKEEDDQEGSTSSQRLLY